MEKDELLLAMLGVSATPPKPIYADRSTVQQYATCPYAAWACREHNITTTNTLREVGTEAHRLAEEAIKTGIKNQDMAEDIADWLLNELPKVPPDIQPQVIQAVKHINDLVL